ncbi:3'(2'),5'-bisphosphate nucleotidase [Hibiscus syriacus]|uniref:3'(2'),5'-bisphosphate nucleotidase n=1 Tax=Hibiscus syriacus TaxID=106335 RepID=A0A6A2ZUJ3_HIBSY|nr:3'(2'),5'-bisphosphate nucleotidase [Hibiscus syriacus]
MAYDKELATAVKAASLAASLCRKVQKGLLQSDVRSKNGRHRSPVTVADYGSQALVSFVLQQEFPGEFSLVAEEDSNDLRKDGAGEMVERITELVNESLTRDGSYNVTLSPDDVLRIIDSGKSEGGSQGRHWVLDPVDGTKGFVRGDQYAVALALLDRGKVVLGVLACPNLPLTSTGVDDPCRRSNEAGCLFFAEVGGGTYMQPLDGSSTVKVQVSGVENPEEASFFESYEAAHSMHDLSREMEPIYLRFPRNGYREKIWDHAAGSIVVTEAGGVVTDAAGNPLDFSRGKYLDLDTGIIVSNHKLMPLVLNAVRASLDEKSKLHP